MHQKGSSEKILYDAGLTRDSTVHNLDVLGLNPSGYRAVVLFHGHAEDHGGLDYALRDGEIRCPREAARDSDTATVASSLLGMTPPVVRVDACE